MIAPSHCKKCGHKWYGRNPNVKPARCPICNAKGWEKEGGRRNLGLSTLVPGSSKVIQNADYCTNSSVMVYARRHGWTLKTTPVENGLIVHRMK
jgi:hypothetical protein